MKGTGATQSTSSSQGRVGVTPTGIEIGLGVGGIGGLGISTDYGGGIVVELGGQKIIWGREGGKIHYNFGGLEVIVEARDCVVVETRKIAGQVVGRNVYRDPGCKPEEPKRKPQPDSPIQQPSSNNPKGIITKKRCAGGSWELVGAAWSASDRRSRLYPLEIALKKRDELTIQQENYNQAANEAWADYQFGRGGWYRELKKATQESDGGQWLYFRDSDANYEGRLGLINRYNAIVEFSFNYYMYHGYDAFYKFSSARFNIKSEIVNATPPPPCPAGEPLPTPSKLLPTANQPPMKETCCEALKADIEDIREVLAVKEILAGEWSFPWELRMPGGKGTEVIMDYPNYLRAMSQMIDHLGIHPPKLSIKDMNNAIAGDQSLSNQFPGATQALEALMAQVWDANGDVDTLTNMLYRLAWLNVQQTFNMAQLTGSVEALKDMLGGETEPLETEITTPFNIAAGTAEPKAPTSRGKGFGKPQQTSKGKNSIDNRVDVNTEQSTEAMLPEFLKVRENPILVDNFVGKQDVFDILLLIRADLENLKSR